MTGIDTRSGVYEKLGVRPIINAQGHRTVIGGSTPTAEVARAMEEAGESFVEMRELLEKSGQRIAGLLGVEAACVTSGAFGALLLSAAACMAGDDPDKIARLPDSAGMKSEFLIQKKQRYSYDRAYSACGGKLIPLGDDDGCTLDDLERAIGPKTAAIAYHVRPDPDDTVVSLADAVELAHSHDLPVIADAAAQNYPLDYFRGNAGAADLVCFAAKYLGAPHSAGFVCGKKDLVKAAVANGFIAFEDDGGHAFGRGLKIDRQEVIGVVTAIEAWLYMNHEDRILAYEDKISTIAGSVRYLPHVQTRSVRNNRYWQVGLHVVLDPAAMGKTADDVARELDAGTPRIRVDVQGDDTIVVNVHAMIDGDEHIVAERLRSTLSG
jgi:L-seryl-tRNA(Ser) seleniumtransferase